MPLIPDPEALRREYEAIREAVLAGREDPDVRFANHPVPLSLWLRARKLIEAVGDAARVLAHLGLDPTRWPEIDQGWLAMLHIPSIKARHDLWLERLDVRAEAAQLLAGPGPVTRGLLEPGAAIVEAPPRDPGAAPPLWALGRALRGAEPPVLRALDLATGALVWEGLGELAASRTPPARGSYAARGPRLFFAHEARLGAADLATGRLLWQAALPAPPAHDDAGQVALFDPLATSGEGPGAVLVQTQAPSLVAFDRDTGAPRWQIPLAPPGHASLHEVPGVGVVVHTHEPAGHWAALLDPRTGAALATFGARAGQGSGQVEAVSVHGALLLLALAEGSGAAFAPPPPIPGAPFPALPLPPQSPPERSVLCVDARTGQPTRPPVRAAVLPRVAPALVGDRSVWASDPPGKLLCIATSPAPGLVGRLLGRRAEDCVELALPDPALLVDALRPAGDAVVALVRPRGQGSVRLLVIDPAAPAIRFDTGDLGPSPHRPSGAGLETRGSLAVVATGTTEDQPTTLLGIDAASGRRLWSATVAGWVGHRFLGDRLVAWTRHGALVLRPADGAALAAWPPA